MGGVAQVPPTNLDLLKWFMDEERAVCGSCSQRACVTVPEAKASFCLGCGAIHIDGERIDVEGRITAR